MSQLEHVHAECIREVDQHEGLGRIGLAARDIGAGRCHLYIESHILSSSALKLNVFHTAEDDTQHFAAAKVKF